MTLRLAFLSTALLLLPIACATTAPPPEDGVETGGSKATGGKDSSGGSTASGGKTSSGGAAQAGGSSSGGRTSGGQGPGGSLSSGGSANGGTPETGGSSSAGGAANSGGSASGGTPSGGAFSGACAGKPTYAEWKASDGQAMGDQIVHQCTVIQSACSGLKSKTDYLFECNQSHVNNCLTQKPEDGQSWTYIGECSAASPSGGMGGESS